MRLPWLLTFALATQAVVGQTLAPGQFAELEGLRLWYRDSGGTGLPVIFLHAASGSSEMWEHQLPPSSPMTAAATQAVSRWAAPAVEVWRETLRSWSSI